MAIKVGRGRGARREEESGEDEERMANQSKSGECKSQEQRSSHPPGSWQAHMAACPHPPHGGECKGENEKGCAMERRLAGARRVSGPLGWRRIAYCKRPAHLLGRKGVCALLRYGAGFRGDLRLAGRCMRQPRLQRVGQAPGAGGVCLFAVIVAGCGAGCRAGIHIACGCRGCCAGHHLLNVPRLMQGRARQRVEQRHQQKHDVERQGGDGAAQHEGMRIILKCGCWRGEAPMRRPRTFASYSLPS